MAAAVSMTQILYNPQKIKHPLYQKVLGALTF
jgi:hypothetical protein